MKNKTVKYQEFLRYQKEYEINEVNQYLSELKDLIPFHLRYKSKSINFDIIPDNALANSSFSFKYKVRIITSSYEVKKYFEQTGPFYVFIVT